MSPQVLNEAYWVASRKPDFAQSRVDLRPYLTAMAIWATAPLDAAVTAEAWGLQDRYRLGFWDSLLLASANRAGCSHFLSEDLNDGQLYGAVQVVNPFRHDPADVLGRPVRIP
jgi:predicted nucleic acid-binding protein